MQSEPRATSPAHATGAVEFVSLDDIAGDERFRLRPEGDVAALASSLGRLGQLVPVELRPLPGASDDGPRWQVVSGFRRLAALRLLVRDRVLARLHGPVPDDEAWALALAHAILGEPLAASDLEALRARLAADGAPPWAGEALDEALARAPLDPELQERFFEFLKGPLAPLVERFGAEDQGAGEGDGATATATATETPTATESVRAERRPAQPAVVEAPTETPTEIATSIDLAAADSDVVEVDADEHLRALAIRLYEVNQDLAAAFASWKDLPLEGRREVLAQARYVAELFPFLEEGSRE